MTDKQIIIDGVPVQDCLFLSTNKMGDDIGTYCRDFNGSCKNIQNCYFKRWQRKEQECEELKKEQRCAWKSLEGTFCPEAQQQLDQLKTENEGFKILHKSDKGLITSIGKMNYQLLQEYDKLKTALTEIKEIAEDAKTKVFVDMEEFWKQILQKISECEVE